MAGMFNRTMFNNAMFNTEPYPSGGTTKREDVFVDFGTQYERNRRVADQKAHEVVEELAQKQAQDTTLDDRERQRQLDMELRLRGILFQTDYLRRLNEMREQLIASEIRQRIVDKLNAQNSAILILLASQ